MFENYKKSKIEQRGLGSRIAAQAYLWLLLVVLYAPILLIIIFSYKPKVTPVQLPNTLL